MADSRTSVKFTFTPRKRLKASLSSTWRRSNSAVETLCH